MPAPMTAHVHTWAGASWSTCQLGALGSVPGSASSSVRKALQSGVDAGPTRKSNARSRSPDSISCGAAPDARWRSRASADRARASASCSGPRPRPGTSIWSWSGARSSWSRLKSPVRWATAQRSGCTSAAATISLMSSLVGVGPPLRPDVLFRLRSTVGAGGPAGNRAERGRYSCMALIRAVIWLLTSTLRGS
jgi:hypothetical protein